MLAIERAKRPTLVVTPTIDLLHQWHDELTTAFNVPIGLVGGGTYDFQPLTITTYDSAYIHLERWGNRYGLIVFDECHHLPGPSYLLTAVGSIAPYRLGLTATPERADQQEHLLPELIGPLLFRRKSKSCRDPIWPNTAPNGVMSASRPTNRPATIRCAANIAGSWTIDASPSAVHRAGSDFSRKVPDRPKAGRPSELI